MTLPHYNQQLNYSYKQSLTPADIKRIASALGKPKAHGNGYLCCCPAHDDHDPSLSISLGMNGQLLVHCFARCEFEDIFQEIKNKGLLPYNLTENRENSRKTSVELVRSPVMSCKEEPLTLQQSNNVNEQSADNDFKEKQKRALKIWKESQEIAGTPAELYLQKRGIDTNLLGNHKDTIKYHPNCGDDSNQQWHGLIAQVTDKSGKFLGLHRIFLTAVGDKMPITAPKRSLGSIKGGGIRLSSSQQAEDKVILTEGLEDALIIAQCCPDYQVIAFLGGNTAIELPESIQEVIIAADADPSGQKQARQIKRKSQEEGKAVGICTPLEGKDINEFFLKTHDSLLINTLISNTSLEVSMRISKKTEARSAFKHQAQELIFLVESLIPLGGICLLAGHPKVGKSWMILNYVLGILKKKKVFGLFATQQVAIFLCSLEDNRQRLKSRYLKISGGEAPPEGFYIKTISSPLDRGGIEELRKELESSSEIKLLIIDPYEKVRPQQTSSRSTAYQTDYKDIGLLKELADELEITILLVHHLKKGDTGNVVTDINGSMGLTGAVNTILALYKKEDTEKFTLKVTGKDVEEQEFTLEFDAETGLYSIAQETQIMNDNLQSQIVEFLTTVQKACSPKEISKALGKNTDSEKTMVRQQLKALVKRRTIKQPRKGFYEIAHKSVSFVAEPYSSITVNLTGLTQEDTKDFEDNCKVVMPDSYSSLDLENTTEIII
jgi:hypothetical protein